MTALSRLMSWEGLLLAMGGGGFTMEPTNPLLDDFVLSLTPAKEPHVLFLPTASGGYGLMPKPVCANLPDRCRTQSEWVAGHGLVDKRGERVRLAVRDHGPGLAQAEIDRIFDVFYQVDGSATRKAGGLGVGLALVRRDVDPPADAVCAGVPTIIRALPLLS